MPGHIGGQQLRRRLLGEHARPRRQLADRPPGRCGLVVAVGLPQIPAELLQPTDHQEDVEDLCREVTAIAPGDTSVRPLGDELAGPEAVEDSAADEPRSGSRSWIEQVKPVRCRHGSPAGLSYAKSADAAYGNATQHSPEHREQSARRSLAWSTGATVRALSGWCTSRSIEA